MVLPALQVKFSVRSGSCHEEIQSCAVRMLCHCTVYSETYFKCIEEGNTLWWKGAAAKTRKLNYHFESIRHSFGSPQQYSTIVQVAWSQKYLLSEVSVSWNFLSYLAQTCKIKGLRPCFYQGLSRQTLYQRLAGSDCRGEVGTCSITQTQLGWEWRILNLLF